MSRQDFPESWVKTSSGEVFKVRGGSQPPKSTFIYEPADGYIRLLQIRDFGEKPVPTYVRKDRVTKFCTEEDILIARYGASLGRILTGMAGAYNVALAKVLFNRECIDPKYVFNYLNTTFFQTPLAMMSRSAQNGFSEGELREFVFPLPPLAEQKRIVAKIEELFSELDAGEESLRRARRQLGVYRQSLLKQAFEGKLTAPWRAQHPDLLSSPDQLLARIQSERQANGKARTRKSKECNEGTGTDTATTTYIPKSWFRLKLCELGMTITGNTPPTSDSKNYGSDIPFVKPPDLTNHPVISTESYLSHRGAEVGRVLPENSVLVTCIGNLGRVGINRIPAAFNQQINAVIPVTSVDSFYLFYAAQSSNFRNQLEGMASATTISIVNKGNFEQISIPLCSLPEQQEIVRLLDEQFEVIEQNEHEIDAALKRSEALRQSILRKAFTGQLVPQDPTDEPASALLNRIHAERNTADKRPNRKAARVGAPKT